MCWYELMHFVSCGHTFKRICDYCHFARNDPFHGCFGVQTKRRDRFVRHGELCPTCGGPPAQGPFSHWARLTWHDLHGTKFSLELFCFCFEGKRKNRFKFCHLVRPGDAYGLFVIVCALPISCIYVAWYIDVMSQHVEFGVLYILYEKSLRFP